MRMGAGAAGSSFIDTVVADVSDAAVRAVDLILVGIFQGNNDETNRLRLETWENYRSEFILLLKPSNNFICMTTLAHRSAGGRKQTTKYINYRNTNLAGVAAGVGATTASAATPSGRSERKSGAVWTGSITTVVYRILRQSSQLSIAHDTVLTTVPWLRPATRRRSFSVPTWRERRGRDPTGRRPSETSDKPRQPIQYKSILLKGIEIRIYLSLLLI